MRNRMLMKKLQTIVMIAVAVLCVVGSASAKEFWIEAQTITKTMPDGAAVTMWGFALCTESFGSCPAATVPGPLLPVPVGDNTLRINVRNSLTGPLAEPISVILPGQAMPVNSQPVRNPDGRVRSFVHETAVGAVGVYEWNDLKPGTYLYQSGSHPAVHIQMGLYGPLKKDAAAGQAYTNISYDKEVVLVYSEIDPALHAAIATGTYGPGQAMTSTMYYEPKYFLINGAPYTSGAPAVSAGKRGEKILVRFLNAGIESHNPLIDRNYMTVIAEDGNAYDTPKELYSLLLPAGKTIDAIIMPATHGTYAVYDRMLFLTNGANATGGMLTALDIDPRSPDKIGVFRSGGYWYLDGNGNGVFNTGIDPLYRFGTVAGDIPVTGDWDGDGKTEIGVFRSGGYWYLDMNGNGVFESGVDALYRMGTVAGDIPVTGDWNGDGRTEIGVFRSGGYWYLDFNGNGTFDTGSDPVYRMGVVAGDKPVTGDWNGDGRTEIGVYRSGIWFLDMDGNGTYETSADATFTFGNGTDTPVTGDWDGNGATEVGIFKAGGMWQLDYNGNGIWEGAPLDRQYTFGTVAGDKPVTGRW